MTRRHVSIILRAPAKLNLDLRIHGRRADGYHELQTLFQSIALCDTLRLSVRPGPLTVTSRNPAVPGGRANLVWRAAEVLWTHLGRSGPPTGLGVSITKVIPVAGGLGGGSSNAAAALRVLCGVWEAKLEQRRLHELAAQIGSDVPFCLLGGLALGLGRGVRLRRLPDLDGWWVVLAIPTFGVSSADAYRWFDRHAPTPAAGPLPRGWRHRLGLLRNDLQGPVAARYPDIGRMISRLRRAGAAHAAMTGSGSTVYGLFRTRPRAVSGRRAIRTAGWRTLLSHTVDRNAFGRLVAARRA